MLLKILTKVCVFLMPGFLRVVHGTMLFLRINFLRLCYDFRRGTTKLFQNTFIFLKYLYLPALKATSCTSSAFFFPSPSSPSLSSFLCRITHVYGFSFFFSSHFICGNVIIPVISVNLMELRLNLN